MHRDTSDPDWLEIIASWKETQLALRKKMRIAPLDPLPRFVAGADAAFSEDKQKVLAAAVVYDRVQQKIVEVVHADRPIEFPYIPTFLSFREAPAVMDAVAKLKHPWGVICCDGQGYAHPRRIIPADGRRGANRPGSAHQSELPADFCQRGAPDRPRFRRKIGHGVRHAIPHPRADATGGY